MDFGARKGALKRTQQIWKDRAAASKDRFDLRHRFSAFANALAYRRGRNDAVDAFLLNLPPQTSAVEFARPRQSAGGDHAGCASGEIGENKDRQRDKIDVGWAGLA